MCFNLSLSISFQVSKTREQDPGAPRVLEPEAGSGLLQALPSRSRGELRGHRVSSNLRRVRYASSYMQL
jgi:hypothetical protein